jgi:hypothetical protein
MYKEKLFTSATDFKRVQSIRVDSRRLVQLAFVVTLTLLILVHTL